MIFDFFFFYILRTGLLQENLLSEETFQYYQYNFKQIFLILLQRYWLPTHYYNVIMKQHFYKERPN